MLASLALVLPLLAGVEALGGDHYVATRNKVLRRGLTQRYDVLERAGGDHYAPHRNKVAGGLPVLMDRAAVEYQRDGAGNVLYDERGLPITATTTVVVPMTETVTVWVDAPTGSVEPTAAPSNGSESAAPSSSGSGSITPTFSQNSNIVLPPSGTESPSASPTGSASGTQSGSASPSPSSADPSASSSAEPSSSADPSASASPSEGPSASASPSEEPSASASSSADPSASGSSSAGPSRSASHSGEPSASASSSHGHGHSSSAEPSASASSEWEWNPSSVWTPEPSPTSFSLSSTASPSASESASRSRSRSDDSEPSSSSSSHHHSSSHSSSHSPSPSASASESPSASSSGTYTPSPTGSLNKRLMNGYYADWTADILPPEDVDWTRFDVLNFAFAEPSYDARLEFTQSNSASLLQRLVKGAHAAGKKVVLSVGGWTGSAHFSSIVADDDRRATFLDNILKAIDQYELDGIDLDWEYPGAPGASGNGVSPDDSDNFLVFLKELRAAIPKGSLITAATQVWPFYGTDGQPMSDVSEFAEIFDWILIMNYDIWGSSSKPGPNAPLSDGCGNSEQPTANAYAAVASWTAAGMPAEKITLGVAAYGYVQKSTSDKLYNRRWNMVPPPHRRATVVKNSDGGTADGQVTFEGLIAQGVLVKDGSNYVGAGGFTRHWDDCSSTPWLKSSTQIVTYDDPQSLNMKGQFAQQAGLRGCSVWSMDGDFIDGSWPLTDAVRSGMGL